ncbi:hypothetical protein [Xanthomonas oryzae]|uniref:hypothetical protein n=1 Tax=Xanthomonas oryzae TaxID=347 RepID=UPI000A69B46D|nr:hypothetical protein [Xanthomonas oryzae]
MAVGCVFALLAAMPGQAQEALDLTPYLKRDQIERIKISPDGDYFALTMPMEDRTVLGIVRRKDKAATARVTSDEWRQQCGGRFLAGRQRTRGDLDGATVRFAR